MRKITGKISFSLLLFVVTVVLFQNCSSNFSTLSDLGNSTAASLDTSRFSMDKKDPQIDQISYKCREAAYAQFNCVDKVLTTQEGLSYNVTFRWNRVDQESVGTVVFLLGADGRGKWRDYPGAVSIQDDFAGAHKIRSVEIEFTDPRRGDVLNGGYWVNGGGYYSAGLAYMEAIGYITANLKSGQFMNHVGGSNGTTVAAFALSHFDAGNYVDRFIFHAGPFLPSLKDACDPKHFASFSQSPTMYDYILSILGTWTFGNATQSVCASNASSRVSLLEGAKKSFPNNGIHVVMGQKEKTEGFGAWILESNLQWYSQVEAADKTRQELANLGHEMEWSAVRAYAQKGRPQPMGAAPVLTFSLALNGAAASGIPLNSTVYGSIRNIDSQSAMGCMAEIQNISACDNPRKWTAFPNVDWTFADGVWRSTFSPAKLGLQVGKVYQGFNINMRTGQRSPASVISIQAATVEEPKASNPPRLVFSLSENGAARTTFASNQLVYGVSNDLPQYGTKACMQEAALFYLCDDPNNWVSLPNNDWSYVNGKWRAQFSPQGLGGQTGKSYIGFHVNTITGERTPPVTLTVQP